MESPTISDYFIEIGYHAFQWASSLVLFIDVGTLPTIAIPSTLSKPIWLIVTSKNNINNVVVPYMFNIYS